MWLDRQEVYLAWAGLLSALIIALSFLGVSAALVAAGHGLAGTVIGTVDLVALVAVFVTGRTRGRAAGESGDERSQIEGILSEG